MTDRHAIQCPHCGTVHLGKICRVCEVTYCQKYAEIYHKGNGECCSKKCTMVIMDRLKAMGRLD